MRERRRRSRKMSGRCPMRRARPSAASGKPGWSLAECGGVERKAHCFVLDLREPPRGGFGSALPAAPGEGHQMQKEHE